MDWEIKKCERIIETVPFAVEKLTLHSIKDQKPLSHPYYRLHSSDWVNILGYTKDQKAILIRQARAGAMEDILEVPGGMVDPGEDIMVAAKRELEEETGYRADKLTKIGSINPNPAIMDNSLHMFLAENCYIPEEREAFPDENEQIEIELFPRDGLKDMVQAGKIGNALAALTILWALI